MKSLLILLLAFVAKSDLASIKAGLNEIALLEVLQFAEESLRLIPLGNRTIEEDGQTINLTNILLNFTLLVTQESFSIVDPCILQINFTDLRTIATFGWADGTLHGQGNVTFPDSYIFLQIEFYVQSGALQVDLSLISEIKMGNAIVTTGLPKIINNRIQALFNSEVPLIENTVIAVIAGFFENSLDPVLLSISKLWPIPPFKVQVNISLTDEPLVEGTYLTLPFRGEYIGYPSRQKIIPFITTPLPTISNSKLPFQLLFSDYSLQYPLGAFWSGFKFNLTNLPPQIPLQLTTDGLAFLFPSLKKTFGPGKPVMIEISSNEQFGFPLAISIPNGVLDLTISVSLAFYVLVSPTELDYAFTLYQQIYTQVIFNETDFVGHIEFVSMQLLNNQLKPDNVTNVDMKTLNRTLTLLVKTIGPIINPLISTFKIPDPKLPFIDFGNTTIQLLDHCILLEAGFKLGKVRDWMNSFRNKKVKF